MEGLGIERRGGTLELTIDRPKANAIDSATSQAMGEAFVAFRDDPELRVAIVTGSRRALLLRGLGPEGVRRRRPRRPRGLRAGRARRADRALRPRQAGDRGGQRLRGRRRVRAGARLRPDRRRSPDARFSLPEVKVGLVPDSGGMLPAVPADAAGARDTSCCSPGGRWTPPRPSAGGSSTGSSSAERLHGRGAGAGGARSRRSRPLATRAVKAILDGDRRDGGRAARSRRCATAASRPTTARWPRPTPRRGRGPSPRAATPSGAANEPAPWPPDANAARPS